MSVCTFSLSGLWDVDGGDYTVLGSFMTLAMLKPVHRGWEQLVPQGRC